MPYCIVSMLLICLVEPPALKLPIGREYLRQLSHLQTHRDPPRGGYVLDHSDITKGRHLRPLVLLRSPGIDPIVLDHELSRLELREDAIEDCRGGNPELT